MLKCFCMFLWEIERCSVENLGFVQSHRLLSGGDFRRSVVCLPFQSMVSALVPTPGCLALSAVGLENLQQLIPLWTACSSANYPKIIFFSYNPIETSVVSVYDKWSLVLPLYPSVQSLALSVQQSPCKYTEIAAGPPKASPSRVSAPASGHLCGLLVDLIKYVNIFLVQGTQNWMQYSRCILTSVKSAGYSLTDRNSMCAFWYSWGWVTTSKPQKSGLEPPFSVKYVVYEV